MNGVKAASAQASFALTLFVSAALMFSVQPMAARMVLPMFGGSPSVWTTCMLFFQSSLLAGYAYAHATSSRLGVGGQAALHGGVLGASLFFLPIQVPPASLASGEGPTWALLGWLAGSVGLPVFAVAATAPMLQRWFARSGHPRARDPYFLYATSNVGSLAALLAYPLWVERASRLAAQSRAWALGFGVLAGLVALCAVVTMKGSKNPVDHGESPAQVAPRDWAAWVALAMVPSSHLLGVTTYLTTDLAAIPLLWVIPLALYLVSFVIAFSPSGAGTVRVAGRLFPILVMALAPVLAAGLVQPFWIPLHVVTFFAAAVVCHGELARRRPPASRLTAFYLASAFGGALGGAFNALVAPSVFDRLAEYPQALLAACLVPGLVGGGARFGRREFVLPVVIGLIAAGLCSDFGGLAESGVGVVATMIGSGLTVLVAFGHRRRPVRFALTVGTLLLASGFYQGVSGRVIHRERSFFGALRVTEVDGGRFHRLFHGSTLHGQQSTDPEKRREPSTYFSREGPIGQVFDEFNRRADAGSARVAVTGVGAGSLAAYAQPGQQWLFAEIDPAVVRIARDPRFFTYLADCRAARLEVVIGDARLTTARAPDHGFDLIVLDAFSSDAIPVHLLDREALALDLRKRAEGGLIAVNITNRYLDLAPVVALLARDAGLVCRVRFDPDDRSAREATGKLGSIWAVIADRVEDFGGLARDPRWFVPEPKKGDVVWTDDYSNLIDHVRFGRRRTP